jgi:RecJ-like exonuclease
MKFISYLLVSLILILILGILSQSLEPETIPLSKVDLKMIDQHVKINCFVEGVVDANGLLIFTLRDYNNSKITAILGEKMMKENLPIKKDDFVEIVGRVTEYENEPEIEIKTIRVK